MLVTTAMVGESLRNERSDSSASATMNSPRPRRAPEPSTPSRPPTTTVGSRPPLSSTSATIEVVVVLPWLPATATPYLRRISSASISVRGITGMPRRRASTTSGFSGFTAVEVTTTWAPRRRAAAWPSAKRAPKDTRRSVTLERFRSEPETV